MTSEQIDSMPAGREMDRLVTVTIFEHPVTDDGERTVVNEWTAADGMKSYQVGPIPHYSTDDAAALEVLTFLLRRRPNKIDSLGYAVRIFLAEESVAIEVVGEGFVSAPTIALATCRAALKMKAALR